MSKDGRCPQTGTAKANSSFAGENTTGTAAKQAGSFECGIEKIEKRIGGIEMTEKEMIDFFEKAHFLHEQMDMDSDINRISNTLSQPFINMGLVRYYIDKINENHPENMVLYNIIFPPQGNRVPLGNASNDSLIQHLIWKQKYLQAKRAGKTFDEFCKEMRKIFSSSMNGGV